MPFDAWCDERIFAPLAMHRTSWHLAGLDRSQIAMPYRYRAGRFVPYGQYGYPDYPDGQLRTSVRQLAHHLLAFMGGGEYAGTRILQSDTVDEMRRVQFPGVAHGQGLIWYRFALRGMRLMGHNGGDDGVATQMYFRPRRRRRGDRARERQLALRRRGWPLQRIAAVVRGGWVISRGARWRSGSAVDDAFDQVGLAVGERASWVSRNPRMAVRTRA